MPGSINPIWGMGEFGPLELVATSLAGGRYDSRQQLLSLAGDGRLDLVDFAGPIPGFFKRTEDQQWDDFRAFPSLPQIAWQDANLRFLDLDGDGLTDVLITEHEALHLASVAGRSGVWPGPAGAANRWMKRAALN